MKIECIYTRPIAGGPNAERQSVRVVVGAGIDVDRYFGAKDDPGQNITFVETEEIERFAAERRRPADFQHAGWLYVVRRALYALSLPAVCTFATVALAADQVLHAPNVVTISPRLVTSGQPSPAALSQLSKQGFGAVIYLAPSTVSDAVPNEAEIVRAQGLEFVNIPIPFGKPTDADFQAFVAAMNRFRDRKVLVHCQVNLRASSLTFLYRVIVDGEDPAKAYDAVAGVWSPNGAWKALMTAQLITAGIAFEPY